MKKEYINPELETIEIKTVGMLAQSPGIKDENAITPGMAPSYDFYEE